MPLTMYFTCCFFHIQVTPSSQKKPYTYNPVPRYIRRFNVFLRSVLRTEGVPNYTGSHTILFFQRGPGHRMQLDSTQQSYTSLPPPPLHTHTHPVPPPPIRGRRMVSPNRYYSTVSKGMKLSLLKKWDPGSWLELTTRSLRL